MPICVFVENLFSTSRVPDGVDGCMSRVSDRADRQSCVSLSESRQEMLGSGSQLSHSVRIKWVILYENVHYYS